MYRQLVSNSSFAVNLTAIFFLIIVSFKVFHNDWKDMLGYRIISNHQKRGCTFFKTHCLIAVESQSTLRLNDQPCVLGAASLAASLRPLKRPQQREYSLALCQSLPNSVSQWLRCSTPYAILDQFLQMFTTMTSGTVYYVKSFENRNPKLENWHKSLNK